MARGGRVLVTGGTGAFGASTTRWLTRRGHDVVVFARNPPAQLARGATYLAGDIRDLDSVRRAMRDCDAVAHFAWTVSGLVTHEQAAPLDLGGTTNVIRAMQDTGCRRLVFASSITAYGAHPDHPQRWVEGEPLDPAYPFVYEWHKAQAEGLIEASGVEAVRVRAGVVVGRHAHSSPANVFRQVLLPTLGGTAAMQMLHQDDCGRFFAAACSSELTGPVNLVADDVLTWEEMAPYAGRRSLATPVPLVIGAAKAVGRLWPAAKTTPDLLGLFLHYPIGDTRRLREDFGFTPAYSSAEALADQGRTSTTYWVLGNREIRKPRRLDRSCGYPHAAASDDGRSVEVIPPDLAGEFDDVACDPDYPEWTCANLAEAFPGPMSPLSLALARETLLSSADTVTHLLGLPEPIRDNVRRRQIATFGHRLYQNTSVLAEMVTAIPGQTPEAFDHQINGAPYPDGYAPPRPKPSDLLAYLHFARVSLPRLAGLDHEVKVVTARAHDLAMDLDVLRSMPDAKLQARLEVVWDDVLRAWQVGNVCTFLVSAPTAMLERRYGGGAVTGLRIGDEALASAKLIVGVQRLAGAARRTPAAREILAAGVTPQTVGAIRAASASFAAELDSVLLDCGHRGPGETELTNPVYGDAPHLLLRAVAGALDPPPTAQPPAMPTDLVGRRLLAAARNAIARRERCRDAVMLTTYRLRQVLQVWGERLVSQRLIDTSDDLHYLTPDELFFPGADARQVIGRRRAERDRLAALTIPIRFRLAWQPGNEGAPSDKLVGTGASAGVARGRVRLMRTPDDTIDSGDILLTTATDTGWTPFFAMAAAVITDIGGLMSHAAIVAREFGIPAVVGAEGACATLRDGQLVEVDGGAGTITVIDVRNLQE